MTNDNEQRIMNKLDFFLNKKIVVHVSKTNKEFLNGILVEKESHGVYVLKENKFGLIHLFVSDVVDVEEYKEVDKNVNDK